MRWWSAVAGRRCVLLSLCVGLAVAFAAGCTYYQTAPAAPGGPSAFDRAWNAALGAAEDVGVAVQSADRTSGLIRASKDGSDVTMRVFTQADGRVRVEIDVKGPSGTDSVLAQQLSAAYNRNMGR
jgi:hypothetical protein